MALEALQYGLLDEVVLCMNDAVLKNGIRLDSRLPNFGSMASTYPIKMCGVGIMVLRK